MPDLEPNGLAMLGLGASPRQDMNALSTLVLSAEDMQRTEPFPTTGVALPNPNIPPSPVVSGPSLVGGDKRVLAFQNYFPGPMTATEDRTSIVFNQKALKDGLDLGVVNHLYDGIVNDPGGSGFGTSTQPTFYKMRAYNTIQQLFEYWVSQGGPSAANPSGQPILAGSLTVIAVKRPKDLVGQGPA